MGHLTETELDGMLYIYYVNKLKEFKLIEGPIPKLTTKGFELTHDLYEDGRKLTEDTIIGYTEGVFSDAPEQFKEGVIMMTKRLQEMGFEKMRDEVKEFKDNFEGDDMIECK